MDNDCHEILHRAALPGVNLLRLGDVETSELARCRATRTRGEYCWTLTPVLPATVMGLTGAKYVTYLDTDIYFFRSPALLMNEFVEADKSALLTEANFSPEYDDSARSGRFCVQFMSFRNDERGRAILSWWQDRCLEWCYNRFEPGRYGDQMYLDEWPVLFGSDVHVCQQKDALLAPWNISGFFRGRYAQMDPILYHFVGFRLRSPTQLQLFRYYRIPKAALWLYEAYLRELEAAIALLQRLGWMIRPQLRYGLADRVKCRAYRLVGKERSVRLPLTTESRL